MGAPDTIHAIDSQGNFLGGFGGHTVIQIIDEEPTEVHVLAPLPEGAITVPTAPTDARAKYAGFTVSNGAAVGGSWDYSGIAVPPDVQGFMLAMKAAVGGAVQANLLSRAYPDLVPALTLGQWADAVALFEDAKTNSVITSDQYAGFQTLANTYHIPITLP